MTLDPAIDLLARARDGEPAALDELHARFARCVHGVVLARVGAADADDVAQDAFARVLERLGQVRDAASLPGWICAVARSVADDHLRRAARAPRRVPLDAEPAGRPEGRDDAELRGRVLARILELPEAYREPLVLRLVEGLDGPEIAARTGLTPGSVRVNLCRGMALLRPLLQREGWA